MSAVGFVLLIMCANLANLMLVRGASRQRELAVRSAMGAGRGRLLWATLAETVLLAVPGAAMGLLLSQWADRRDDRRVPGRIAAVLVRLQRRRARRAVCDRRRDLHDARGGPAAGAARGAPESRQRLEGRRPRRCRSAAAGSGCRPASSLRRWRCVSRLLVGANLMVQSFLAMQRAEPRLRSPADPRRRAAIWPATPTTTCEARSAFYSKVVDTLRALPGVSAAAVTTAMPGDDGGDGPAAGDRRAHRARPRRSACRRSASAPGCSTRSACRCSRAARSPMQEMQDPDADVAVLNQELARRLWPGESPIDRRIGFRVQRRHQLAARRRRGAERALRGNRRGHRSVAAQRLCAVCDDGLATDGDAGARPGRAGGADRADARGAAPDRADVPDVPADADARAAAGARRGSRNSSAT